jgi:hypothetical protein
MMPLENERETYERNRPALLAQHRGSYALIKGEEIVGVFPDAESALREGVGRFGMEPFLVKQILDQEPLATAPAFSLPPNARPQSPPP